MRTDHPIQDILANRWSPYCFSERSVPTEDLLSLLEAARWAPSSYNEQPWRFILTTRDNAEDFDKAVACLVEGNQPWAKRAPVLLFTVTHEVFDRNGKPNAACEHDIGLTMANLTVEATARGLCVHQMIGINPAMVRATYQVPEQFKPLTAAAIGYLGDESDQAALDDAYLERDQSPRTRNPIGEWVFGTSWAEKSKLLQ